MSSAIQAEIRTVPRPSCALCGARGKPLYRELADRRFHVPGRWGLNTCPDPACGLIWLDPAPVEDDLVQAYRQYYTHATANPTRGGLRRARAAVAGGYLRRRLGYTRGIGPNWHGLLAPLASLLPGGREEAAAEALFLDPPAPGARLLEVGCGSGEQLARLRDLGWDVEGIDFDAEAVASARSRGLPVRHGLIGEQDYPEGHFDVVVMVHVIEHVPDPIELLRQCRELLKPGGRLVAITPNVGSWGHRRYGRDWLDLDPPRHLNLFSMKNFGGVLARAGFEDVRVQSLCRNARSSLAVSHLYRAHLGATWEELGRRPYRLRWKLRWSLYQYGERVLVAAGLAEGEEILGMARRG